MLSVNLVDGNDDVDEYYNCGHYFEFNTNILEYLSDEMFTFIEYIKSKYLGLLNHRWIILSVL